MSMKNRVLLHSTGSDQFGNKGEPPLSPYVPSETEESRFQREKKEHEALNEEFSEKFGSEWLEKFFSKSKKDVWKVLYPFGKPGLSAFYGHVREHDSMNAFLLYWLVSNKRKAMKYMGYTKSEVDAELSKFTECGRYFVSFGKGRPFSTPSI